MDSLPSHEKLVSTGTNNSPKYSTLPYTNWSSFHSASYSNTDSSNAQQTTSYVDHNEQNIHVQNDNNEQDAAVCVMDDHNLEDVSMSILSLSLKQKLSELNEITKRLQSRLRDVTNTAFEDDFDSDFEANESNSEHEDTDNKNAEIAAPAVTVNSSDEILQVSKQQCKTQSDQKDVNSEKQISSDISSDHNSQFEPASKLQSRAINPEIIGTAYCSNSNMHSNHSTHHQYPCNLISNYSSDSSAEYPARGTKMHINHLLDKLSLDFPIKPQTADTNIPIKRNIVDLFAKLREHRNHHLQTKNKSGVDTCSVPTQTDNTNEQRIYDTTSPITPSTNAVYFSESVSRPNEESQSHNKISTVIREELIAEENDDTVKWDDLTTYLITTNIRYRNVDDMVNPLLYKHLLPDLQATSAVSPEGETVEQLDSQYMKSFSTAMKEDKIDRSAETNLSQVDAQEKNHTDVSESKESAELIRSMPSSASGNVIGNIDVTVVHKFCDNDLTLGNSTESTVGTSLEKLSIQQVDVETENCRFTELPVLEISRQAPDGGNPVEEVNVSVMTKRQKSEAKRS